MKNYALTRYGKENGKNIIKESDHNPIIGKFCFNVKIVKKDRKEMFNLRNTECQKNLNMSQIRQMCYQTVLKRMKALKYL